MGESVMMIDLAEVWRDKNALENIRAEIKLQAVQKWRAWEILLPPDLLYPMITEVSQGMYAEWSPVLDRVGIQLGNPDEIAIRFVLPDMKTSPVKLQTMKYIPMSKDNIIPIEVNSGN